MQKQVKLKKYNLTIAKLLKVTLSMSEKQQEMILKLAEDMVRGDRRIADRKSCRLRANFATTDRAHMGFIKNISISGVFIESKAPVIIGEEILMVFKVNRDSEAVKLRGEIAHATRLGIGVEFTAEGPQFDEKIRDIIQRIK